jgi:hypothetical protein
MSRPASRQVVFPGAVLLLGFLTGTSLQGCGAKTGLLVPEWEQDAAVEPDAEPRMCVDIEPGEELANIELDVSTRLLSADVFFLIDCTGSMRGEIANIQRGLTSTIVPGALAQIPDIRFGVGAFGDFHFADYGARGDLPFAMRRAITHDMGAVQAAIDALPEWDGDDLPESQVEALYQVATGEGFGDFIPPAPGCPQRGLGYPCFREGSQPVVMLITDAPFHNGPRGEHPYRGLRPVPHSFDQAIEALQRLEIRVIGISSQPESEAPLRQVAQQTGAADGDGVPLVYSISPTGRGLDQEVVRGIETLARRVPLDVDAIVLDGSGDDVDATVLVERVVALRADPATGVERIEGDTFYNAMPGTHLTFGLEIRVDNLPIPPTTQLYPVVVRIRGNRTSVLREEVVYIEVPGLDGADLC